MPVEGIDLLDLEPTLLLVCDLRDGSMAERYRRTHAGEYLTLSPRNVLVHGGCRLALLTPGLLLELELEPALPGAALVGPPLR